VYGMGGTRDHYTFFAAALPDDVDVIALDLPGFGESTKDPALHYDRAAQVARLRAFIEQRGIPRYHLVGHSMGGMLAAELALRTPEGIESLVLFDPAGIDAPDQSREMPDVIVDSPEKFDELMKASFVKPPAVPGFLKQYFADEMQRNAPFAKKVRAEIFADWGTLAARLPGIKPATLVVWGDQDRVIDPSAAEIWREALRGNERSDVVIMRETGHAPMLERPHESAALLFQWWRTRAVLR
jgi:abhydrolase domain-containing protein 6